MDIWPVLKDELEKYYEAALSIKRLVGLYEKRCEELILNIARSEFSDADALFDELFDIQSKLAVMLYKYEYIPDRKIKDLIYYLDRDDIYSRKHWFKKFTEGQRWPDE
ncbi:hypothetical protein [Erwinia persicina]|uniref:hypothetical protein n=1 Tax=Erwinia persicina TaxID=55211 RepID=UPI00177D7DDD|nr:hypothetical protein [Erwinia persicina]MBD8169140.1 hypothetical protein [Erwinia persicina]